VQPKINLQSFKSTPDSLKQHLTALERKRSLGAPEENSFIALVQAPLHEERWKTNLYKAMSPVNPFALPLF